MKISELKAALYKVGELKRELTAIREVMTSIEGTEGKIPVLIADVWCRVSSTEALHIIQRSYVEKTTARQALMTQLNAEDDVDDGQ